LGLSEVGDQVVWDYAKANGFAVVSQDVDFAEMAALLGSPPKVIWLRAGNQSTTAISTLIRRQAESSWISATRTTRYALKSTSLTLPYGNLS
jgi:predicted nuclease of predicted toxin-antitoxin system